MLQFVYQRYKWYGNEGILVLSLKDPAIWDVSCFSNDNDDDDEDDNDEDGDVVVELLMMMYGNAHYALLHWI